MTDYYVGNMINTTDETTIDIEHKNEKQTKKRSDT